MNKIHKHLAPRYKFYGKGMSLCGLLLERKFLSRTWMADNNIKPRVTCVNCWRCKV
jgi:hypothetical protein